MKRSTTILICLILLIFRLWLATQSKHGDMYNNLDWGRGAAQYGLTRFYDLPKEVWPHSRPNQPAGSILLHLASYQFNNFTSQLINWINISLPIFPSKLVWWWEQSGELISVKLPSILADFAIAAALVRLTKKSWVGWLYLLNPALWYNSGFWGQTDSTVAAFAIWSLVWLSKSHLLLSTVFLGVSLATKASWLPLVPLYSVYYARKFASRLPTLLLVPLTILAVFFPFHPRLDLPTWLWQLFTQRLLPGESGFASVSAFNLWHLIFGQNLVPDSTWGINLIGPTIILIILGILGYRLWKKPDFSRLVSSSAILFFAVFLFATRMHERYLYPLFPLLSLGLPTLWPVYLLASLSYLINLYYQWYAPFIPAVVSLYSVQFTKMVSAVNLGLFAYVFHSQTQD